VTTEALRAHVATIAPPDRIHLIPNGVDLARFSPAARAEGRRGRIVYVGRLSAEKNLSALVRAVAAVQPRVPAELVLIGENLDEPAIRRQLWACRAPGGL